jgi:hypothetical protein
MRVGGEGGERVGAGAGEQIHNAAGKVAGGHHFALVLLGTVEVGFKGAEDFGAAILWRRGFQRAEGLIDFLVSEDRRERYEPVERCHADGESEIQGEKERGVFLGANGVAGGFGLAHRCVRRYEPI